MRWSTSPALALNGLGLAAVEAVVAMEGRTAGLPLRSFGTLPDDDRLGGWWSRIMAGFEVQIGQLRDAAVAAGSAADQATVVDPGTGLDAIATALPGGVAAMNAPTLASTFNERAKGWAAEIDQWSDSVTAAAKAYSENEDSARRAFGG